MICFDVEKRELFLLKKRIDAALKEAFTPTSPLFHAVHYALTGGGKRVRPLIVHLVAEALGEGLDVTEPALACEFFHTASLIADDLPCMDNDDFRRDRPSLHKVYGETTALLASFGLITEGFRRIEKAGQKMRQVSAFSERAFEATAIALECASRCAGLDGAVLGQYLDLFPPKLDEHVLTKLVYLKTVTLFEGAFILGFVFGGGSFDRLSEVKELAYHFGLAFQARDDLSDLLEDRQKEKATNMALLLGEETTQALFEGAILKVNSLLDSLQLNTAKMAFLVKMLAL